MPVISKLVIFILFQKQNIFDNDYVLNKNIKINGEIIGPITENDIDLNIKIEHGETVEKDCNCDSSFMITIMPKISTEIRKKFHWVDKEDTIYLVMDNAGGHGTKNCKQKYINILKEKNIEIIWQCPRSPETNALDLGIWMCLQSVVTKVHRLCRCSHIALAYSIEEAFNEKINVQAFINVFD